MQCPARLGRQGIVIVVEVGFDGPSSGLLRSLVECSTEWRTRSLHLAEKLGQHRGCDHGRTAGRNDRLVVVGERGVQVEGTVSLSASGATRSWTGGAEPLRRFVSSPA